MAHSIRQLAWGVGGRALLLALVPPLSLTGSWFVGIHGLLVVVAVVLVGTGLVAAWAPAPDALRAWPLKALRDE
jgi:hypothetical protein